MTPALLPRVAYKPVYPRRESLSLADAADILFRKKLRIVAGVLLVAAAAAALVVLSPRQYRSEMLLLLKNDRPDPGSPSGGAVYVGREIVEAQMATEVELLTSDELLSTAIVKNGLAPGGPDDRASMDRALRKLRKHLRVVPGVKSNVISVEVAADSPEHAAAFLDTLAAVYLDRHLEIHRVAGSFAFFQAESVRAAAELDAAQKALAQFEEGNNTVMLEQQKSQKVKSLADLQSALRDAGASQNEAKARNAVLEEQVAGVAARVTTQSREIPNQYSMERLNTMLAELRNKRTELLTKFQPNDRMVKEVDQQISQTLAALEQTRGTVAKEEATDINPIRQSIESDLLQSRNHLAGIAARAAALNSQIAAARQDLDHMAQITGQHDDMVRAVKEAESRYQTLAAQMEQARLNDQMDRQRIANVVVAEEPTRRGIPEASVNANVISGAALGLIAILAAAFAGGMRRKQVFTAWELEGVAGAPVLGTVPLERIPKILPAAEEPLEIQGEQNVQRS
jgi:uncharacterized protein involved in exopolysaccharide biosynthesis